MVKPTRRGFIMGCSAAAAFSGARLGNLAFAAEGDNDEILVVIFLRGGADGLNIVMPVAGPDRGHYEAARPSLMVPASGPDAALALDGQLGLHPALEPLYGLYQDDRLSIIHATGMTEPNRSHFDAMEFIELGTPGNKTTSTGWLTRHFRSATNLPPEIIMPSVSVGSTQATSLLGDRDTVNMTDPDSFNLRIGPYRWRDAQRVALRHLYTGDSTWLHESGLQALDASDIVELNTDGAYEPANGAEYPSNSFGDRLQVIAQMTKLGLGLRVASIDLGGWDTHNGQGNGSGGYFAGILETLGRGLEALYVDLDGSGAQNYTNRLTVVVQSEFGRRLRENADDGTDHGHGNVMFVLSGNATGGIHGVWPGLSTEQLFDNADLAVTTDFRRVLSEILIRRLGNNHLGFIFPGYSDYEPLGIVSGTDLPPDYSGSGTGIFADGFESGSAGGWSSASSG
ncbi:MAG: DUF1501 domain-containing protein [bacterium]|nr:DUF1501 domain-containing protein [bacterium]